MAHQRACIWTSRSPCFLRDRGSRVLWLANVHILF